QRLGSRVLVSFNYVAQGYFGIAAGLPTIDALALLRAFTLLAADVYLLTVFVTHCRVGVEIIVLAISGLAAVLSMLPILTILPVLTVLALLPVLSVLPLPLVLPVLSLAVLLHTLLPVLALLPVLTLLALLFLAQLTLPILTLLRVALLHIRTVLTA